MFFLDYDVCALFCQRGSASRAQRKLVTNPLVKAWTSDHQIIYPQLAKGQITRTGDKTLFSLPLQKSYSRSGNASMFIHKVTLLSGVYSSALNHMVREMEVEA